MMKNKKKGFTLVELLAVIVILAIILVIAVPKVMSVIIDSKKATLESTVKMIASAAEKAKIQNTILGTEKEIECEDIVKLNDIDYKNCKVKFEGNTAKVTIEGSGKFSGLYVCDGTKTVSVTNDEKCITVVSFEDDNWLTILEAVQRAQKKGTPYPYNVGESKIIEMDIDDNGYVEEYAIRVSNTKKCDELEQSVVSETACGFVLEFVDIITKYNMNPAGEYNETQYPYGTNLGEWPASKMRKYLNDENDVTSIYNLLPRELRDGIINTYVVSSHGANDKSGKLENYNFGSYDKLYLLSPREVWGISFSDAHDTSRETTRQLDYYADYQDIGVSKENYEGAKKTYQGSKSNWWLRSADSYYGDLFYNVGNDGSVIDWPGRRAYNGYGVSPAFRLAN